MRSRHFVLMLSTLLLCQTLLAGQRDAESAFAEAASYTVRITALIPTPFLDDDAFAGFGAGFLVDKQRGWIVTNAHVAGRSPSRLEVQFKDEGYLAAEKVYVDPHLDIGVIRIPVGAIPDKAIDAPLDCEGRVNTGHPVGAYGHPWDLNFTGTRGIISARRFFENSEMLQMDAPINGGNSGGPLISLATGRVVGVNTAAIKDEQAEGLNFAVPIDSVCKVIELLRAGQDPSPPELKIIFYSGDAFRNRLKVAFNRHLAQEVDLRPGDIILGIAGLKQPVENESQLIHALRGNLHGTSVHVLRDGKERDVVVTFRPAPRILDRLGVYVSGMLLAPYKQIRDADMLGIVPSLMVHSVEPNTAAELEGFEHWDIIATVDGQSFTDPNALYEYLASRKAHGEDVTMTVLSLTNFMDRYFEHHEFTLPLDDVRLIHQ